MIRPEPLALVTTFFHTPPNKFAPIRVGPPFFNPFPSFRILRAFALTSIILLTACAQSYTVPGGPADLAQLGLTPEAKAAATDYSVQSILDKKPLVTFPASIAITRVQAAGYRSFSFHGYGPPPAPHAAYSVITVRDIEKDTDFDSLAKLPQVSGLVTMKQILLDRQLNNDEQLRAAAAKLHANLLLFYTFDTAFYDEDRIRPLGVITLGLFPNHIANVTTTASAILMDVNNGYIYAVVEATAKNDQLANAWSSEQAMDDARQRAERQAFEGLLAQFKSEWTNVVIAYNHPAAQRR